MSSGTGMLGSFKKKFFCDKAFLKIVLALVIPIIVQNGISNFVNLLDNLMVGRLGTEAISGVSIVNQLVFVLNITIFGICAAGSIYGAQYYGNKNMNGVRDCMRLKFICALIFTAIVMVIFGVFGNQLISLFLSDSSSEGDIGLALKLGRQYLNIILIGLVPYVIVQVYASSLRDAGETVSPMYAGIAAIVINLIFNYLLIFGKFGCPKLGVQGAAIATVISRYAELLIILIATHTRTARFTFIKGLYRSFKVPVGLVKNVLKTGAPLLANEILFSSGQTVIIQGYSTRGLSVVAATNIASTAWNLFTIIMLAFGQVIAIVVGQRLGAGNKEEAVGASNKLMFLNEVIHIVLAIIIIIIAPYIPLLYNTSDEVRRLATNLLRYYSYFLPVAALYTGLYFTIRSGGKTLITFLFDACFTWILPLPLVGLLCRFTALPVLLIVTFEKSCDIIRMIIGFILLKSGIWIKNLVGGDKPPEELESPQEAEH